MGFQHITAEQINESVAALVSALAKKLARHAESYSLLELRKQSGKEGYKPCGHRWEDDGADGTLTDDHGNVVLICGVTPEDLSRRIVEAAISHVEETGDRKNYRVYGLQATEGKDGADLEEVFSHLIPQTIFGEGSSGPITGGEHHDALMASFDQLRRQNDRLFAMMMQVIGQTPNLMSKITGLIEELGDSLSGREGNNAEAVLKILEFESQREARWMAHEAAKSSGHDRAQLLEKMLEIAGPDVIAFLKEILRDLKKPQAEHKQEREADNRPPSPPKTSDLAAQLNKIFDGLNSDAVAKVKMALSPDEWSLIEAARKAESDDEFREIFGKLEQLWRERGEEDVKRQQAALIDAIGIPAAMALMRLVKNSTR